MAPLQFSQPKRVFLRMRKRQNHLEMKRIGLTIYEVQWSENVYLHDHADNIRYSDPAVWTTQNLIFYMSNLR